MSQTSNILIDSLPRKGFRGMREDKDPRALDPGECVSLKGMRLRDGMLDGKTSGSGDAINTTAFGFDIYDAAEFKSSSGKNFILAFTSTGKIIYTANAWADWDNEATSKSFAETADGTDLELEGETPHLHISWVVRGNRDIVFSNGIDSYIIDGSFWPGGALKITTNVDLPPFVRGLFLGGRTLLDDGERCWLSSPTDPNRFRSTLEERLDDVYDDNQWAGAAAQGVSGYNTALCQMNETSAFLATQNGIFWIGLAPDAEGISRLNIICALKGAGCSIKNAAYVNEFGLFTFYSNYEGGAWLMMGRGSYANLPGDPINLDAEAGFWVNELAPGIRKTLQGLYQGDSALIGCGKDTRQEFEQVSAVMRAGADTENDPGWMMLGTSNKLPYTPRTPAHTTMIWDGNGVGVQAAYTDNGDRLHDGNPTYPDTASPTYLILRNPDTYFFLMNNSADAKQGIYADGAYIQALAGNAGWQEVTINKYCSSIALSWWFANRPESEDGKNVSRISIPLTIDNGPQFISKIRIFGLSFTGPDGSVTGSDVVKIGQIELYGTNTDVATYIDHIQKVEGLTANSQLEFGRFLAGFRKIDSDYYPIFRLRVGKSATLDTLGTSTLSASTLAGATTINVAAITTGVEVGDKITITDATNGNETRYIAAISLLAITPDEPLTYAHASGLTVTYTGSALTTAASSNWSPWTTLTLAQITAGYKFSALRYRTASANVAAVSDATGNLWTQIKVTFNLKKSVGFSSATDFWRFQFLKGTLALANHLIQSCYDASLIMAAPGPGATGNNMVLGHKIDLNKAGSFLLENQEIKAFVHSGTDYLAFMGRSWVKYWKGYKNLRGNSSTHYPLGREWMGRGIDSEDISPLELKVLVRSYNQDIPISGAEVTAETITPELTGALKTFATPVITTGSPQKNAAHLGADGCIYTLIPEGSATVCYSIYLSKYDPLTGLVTKTLISTETTLNTNGIHAFSMAISNDKRTLYIFWGGGPSTGTVDARVPKFSTYDIPTQSLNAMSPIETGLITNDTYGYLSLSAVVDPDGNIWVATSITEIPVKKLRIYKSTNGKTFTLSHTSTTTFRDPQMYITWEGNPAVLSTTALLISWIAYSAGAWGSQVTICVPPSSGAYAAVALSTKDLIIAQTNDSGIPVKCYVRTSGTTWTLLSTVAAASDAYRSISIIRIAGTANVMVIYNYTTLKYTLGDGTTWDAAANVTTGWAGSDLIPVYSSLNDIYFWAIANAGGSYYKLYKRHDADDPTLDTLWIGLETNAGELAAYSASDDILDTFQPADGRVPQTGKVNYIRPKIRTTSPVEIASCDLAATK